MGDDSPFPCLQRGSCCPLAERTCITSLPELQSTQLETQNASRPGTVKNHRSRPGSIFDHIFCHSWGWSTRRTPVWRVPKSRANKAEIAGNMRRLLQKSHHSSLGPPGRRFKSCHSDQRPQVCFMGAFYYLI